MSRSLGINKAYSQFYFDFERFDDINHHIFVTFFRQAHFMNAKSLQFSSFLIEYVVNYMQVNFQTITVITLQHY